MKATVPLEVIDCAQQNKTFEVFLMLTLALCTFLEIILFRSNLNYFKGNCCFQRLMLTDAVIFKRKLRADPLIKIHKNNAPERLKAMHIEWCNLT